MQEISTKAPTKIILMGEHAAVYGEPALVMAIDQYCHCHIRPSKKSDRFFYYDKDNYIKADFSLAEIKNINKEKLNKERAEFVKLILKTPLEYMKIKNPAGFDMRINLDMNMSGCGLSTSYMVSIASALAEFYDKKLTKEDLFNITMKGETELHGYESSGADQSAIVYGGLIRYKKAGEVEKINLKSDYLKNILLINSGRAEVCTGEVVAHVKERYKKNSPKIAGCSFIRNFS